MMKKGKIKKQSQGHSVYGQFLIDMQQKFAGILEKTCGMEAGAFEAIVLGDKTNLDPELSDGRNYTYPGDFGAPYQSSWNGTV